LTFSDSGDEPAQLLMDYEGLFSAGALPGPVLDLACGTGRNSIYLAQKGFRVTCCDISPENLEEVKKRAEARRAEIELWQVDLQREKINPLPEDTYGGILVFRYLHRPLMECIRKALRNGGLLIYETFTREQRRFGKPHNPNFLLNAGELLHTFEDWEVIHYFEGIKENPTRAVAQIVCRKKA
jgi:SAM-dependent methyltransferase